MAIELDKATLRRVLFTPCKTKEDLSRFIKVFLGLDLPDCTVDPTSNSNPMDLVHYIYNKTLLNDDENFNGAIFFCARDTGKTLDASIIQLLFTLHFDFNAVIAAAIEAQAVISTGYIKSWLHKPHFREFITTDNERMIEITHYEHSKNGEILAQSEYDELPTNTQATYIKHCSYIKIVVATVKSMNGNHTPLLCLDELDIAPEKPVQEGKMMLTPGPNGRLPVLLMTSTRKYAFGPVQKEINRVETGESNLKIFHWNIIDVTQACAPARHKPELPKIPIYLNIDKLDAISEEQWQSLPSDEQSRFDKTESFAGCLKCKLYPVCRGRLATDQKSKSKLLKPIPHVINLFKTVEPETAKAQLMCWKPGSEGLIYPKFDVNKHVITASQMAEKITGEAQPINFSKKQLVQLMQKEQLKFYSGMDFGYTHLFAVVTAALVGKTLFIFDVISAPHLEDTEKVEICDSRIKYLNPTLFPDPASPQTIKLFRKNGYSCKNFKKDILGGIETVRRKLTPGINSPEPELFILKYDQGCDKLIRTIKEYHWITDSTGSPTNTPDEKDDDELDSIRYLCCNLFTTTGGIKTGDNISYKDYTDHDLANNNWITNEINKRINPNERPDEPISGGKNGFKFQF